VATSFREGFGRGSGGPSIGAVSIRVVAAFCSPACADVMRVIKTTTTLTGCISFPPKRFMLVLTNDRIISFEPARDDAADINCARRA
jgi:hypothetical protein